MKVGVVEYWSQKGWDNPIDATPAFLEHFTRRQ
jgi:hypothetical protein